MPESAAQQESVPSLWVTIKDHEEYDDSVEGIRMISYVLESYKIQTKVKGHRVLMAEEFVVNIKEIKLLGNQIDRFSYLF